MHFPFCQIKPPAVYGNQWALPDDDPDCENEDETKDPPVCDDTNHLQEAERMCAHITEDEGREVKGSIPVLDNTNHLQEEEVMCAHITEDQVRMLRVQFLPRKHKSSSGDRECVLISLMMKVARLRVQFMSQITQIIYRRQRQSREVKGSIPCG